jgi:hypothetical protein
MNIRTGSWDSFVDHIRWSRPPASPPPQANQPSACAPQRQRSPAPAAGPSDRPGRKGWFGRLLAGLGL